MYAAIETVHTSGINWESVAVIASIILGISGTFVGWIGRKITLAVNDLGDKLELKLETKESVNAINRRVVRIETTLHNRGEL